MATVDTAAPQAPTREAFQLTLPEGPAARLIAAYEAADHILEYGSGGSSFVAVEKGASLVTVESDPAWAAQIDTALRAHFPDGRFTVHHADIGETTRWGRPKNNRGFRRFHTYSTAVWDMDNFEGPDTVLIDGRFRPACFATVAIRTRRPVTVLFDDYADRPRYHWVEAFAKPVELVDRMAVFELEPAAFPPALLTRVAASFMDPT